MPFVSEQTVPAAYALRGPVSATRRGDFVSRRAVYRRRRAVPTERRESGASGPNAPSVGRGISRRGGRCRRGRWPDAERPASATTTDGGSLGRRVPEESGRVGRDDSRRLVRQTLYTAGRDSEPGGPERERRRRRSAGGIKSRKRLVTSRGASRRWCSDGRVRCLSRGFGARGSSDRRS